MNLHSGSQIAYNLTMTLWSDVRVALRALRKAPLATLVACFALALGIGANVSAFIGVNGIVLHPLPFAHLDRVQTIWQTDAKTHTNRRSLTPADFIDLESQSSRYQFIAAVRSIEAILRSNSSAAETIRVAQVSPLFFNVFSAQPALGQILSGPPNTVVISDSFWKGRLAAAPNAIGKKLSLSTGIVTIVGVMPDDFDYPLGADMWMPLELTPQERAQRDGPHNLQALALLRSGESRTEAAFEASTIAARLAAAFPATHSGQIFEAVPLRDLTGGITHRFILLILVCGAFVLLLACANVGNLQLARATHRQKEMAVRAALGASRLQIARPVLVESLTLSLAAGALAVFLADWNNFFTKQNIPALALRIVPGLRTMRVDPYVLLFAFAISVAAGLFCCLPAVLHLIRRISQDSFEESLRERASVGGHRSAGVFRSGLIVSEIALALVLLMGAGLMLGTFQRLLNLNQGFNPKGVLTANASLPQSAYQSNAARLRFFDQALNNLSLSPGISSAALVSSLGVPAAFHIEGRPSPQPGELVPEIVATSSQYGRTLQIPLLEGRPLAASDSAASRPVIVLSRAIAQTYWPNGASPIGHRIQWQKGGEWFTIVGVSADIVDDWFLNKSTPVAYVSYAQVPPSSARFFLRVQSGDPLNAAPVLRAKLQSLDSSVPVFDINAYDRALAEERSGVRAASRAMSTYAGIALLLAITGIYALVSYLVSLRTHDIGIHMALGATRAAVVRMTTGHTGKLILIGMAIGVLASLALAQIMSHILFDVVHLDASLWIILTAALTAAAFLAAGLPALRAATIDPVSTLRHE